MKNTVVIVLMLLVGINMSLSADKISKYQKACDGGSTEECLNLGVMYANGYGVKQDYFKAKEYFGKACDLKN